MGLEKISELKKKLGLTTEDLSIKSGVPIGTLNKILNGTTKDPKLETLKAIAKVLRLTLDDFDDDNRTISRNTYDEMITVYTRSKKNLSQAEKMRLAQIILSEDED